MRDIDQQRRELRAAPRVAADRQRPKRVAVITLPARDEVPALGLANLDEILARELQRRSIASEPPETRYTCDIPAGACAIR